MSGVEILVIGAVIGGFTNLVTDGINPLITFARTAVRCQEECEKLAEVTESIKPDVEHIIGQLEELEVYDPNAGHSLKLVEKSVKELKEELHLADIEVHHCNTASRIGKKLGSYRLSKKITEHMEKITALGKELVQVSMHLTNLINAAKSRCDSMEMHQRLSMELQEMKLQHRASLEAQQAQPALDFEQWRRDTDDIQQRADSTRQRLQSESLGHGGYGSSTSSLYTDDSSHHSSHHLKHTSDPSGYHRRYTTASTHHLAHPDAQFRRSYTAPTHDHITHSEGVKVRFQDPFVPHLLL